MKIRDRVATLLLDGRAPAFGTDGHACDEHDDDPPEIDGIEACAACTMSSRCA